MVYFNRTEGNPIGHMLRFLIFGEGDVPPVTHEFLRHSIDEGGYPVDSGRPNM